MEILDEIKKDYVQDLIRRGKRPDERGFEEYRKITIEPNVLKSAEGSAKVRMGDTQILVGIKFGVGAPFADRPKEGVLATNAELLPLASPSFEPGPPDERSIELARVVDRGIRSAGVIDLESFFIDEGKVWALFIDLYVLDYDGNLIDAAALAAMSALLNAKWPKYENGHVIRNEYQGNLKIDKNKKVVACTFAKINGSVVLDPCLDEEIAMSARLSLATTGEHLCAAQKAGSGSFTRDEIVKLTDLALAKGSELRALI